VTIRSILDEPVVITGIGMVASVGGNRESVWRAVQRGESRFGLLSGLRGIPDGEFVGATVDLETPCKEEMKVVTLNHIAASEALEDAGVDFSTVDRSRFGCSLCGHMGDSRFVDEDLGLLRPGEEEWWTHFFPSTACQSVARRYGLGGPRLSYSTACASSLICVQAAARSIRDRQCDIALAGGADAIDPLFVAGFNRMRVLAKDPDPSRACRPFDVSRKGFVFGEGGAVFVVERLSHALRRGARIYAEVAASRSLSQAHHVTGLDADCDALEYLIRATLEKAGVSPGDVGYINAHGTGTEQNDLAEARGICRAFGRARNSVWVSSTKSILGHLINAAGSTELAITALALRDGFAPPTLNLTQPDPACEFDCLPLAGRPGTFQHALKLSLAFGGHLVAVLLSRWNDSATGFAPPQRARAA
jgi:3-oxoacyl-(acyl-carrier-protein) synthase